MRGWEVPQVGAWSLTVTQQSHKNICQAFYVQHFIRPIFWMALSLGNVYPIFGCASKWKSEKSFMNFVGFCFDCDNT